MAISHLIFNRLKWFNVAENADNVTANGRNFYALPSKIKTTTDNIHLYAIVGDTPPGDFSSGTVFTVVGAYKNTYSEDGKKRYLVSYSGSSGDAILDISGSDCTPIWGGKALLSHVYQWFRDAFRMVVIA